LSSQTEFENIYLFATFTNGVHKACFWTGLGEGELIKAFGLVTGKGKSTLGHLGEALRSMLQETCLSRIDSAHNPTRANARRAAWLLDFPFPHFQENGQDKIGISWVLQNEYGSTPLAAEQPLSHA